jgi:hypothetical protein
MVMAPGEGYYLCDGAGDKFVPSESNLARCQRQNEKNPLSYHVMGKRACTNE